MDKSGSFTIRTNRVDGSGLFSATIEWSGGRTIFSEGKFKTSRAAFDQALIVAGKIIDDTMRLRYPNA